MFTLFLFFFLGSSSQLVLEDSNVYLSFDSSDFKLLKFGPSSQTNFLHGSSSLWSAQFVSKETGDHLINIDSNSYCRSRTYVEQRNQLFLFWNQLELTSKDRVTVNLTLSLVPMGLSPSSAPVVDPTSSLQIHLEIQTETDRVGLWQWSIGPTNIKLTPQHSLLENVGFGVLHECSVPGNCKGWSGYYPQSTFQFMAAYMLSQSNSGIYFGVHDPRADSKTFLCDIPKNSTPGGETFSFRVEAQPQGAGRSFRKFVTPFPIVLSFFDGDWWDAAQIYRSWALTSARWTSLGPVVQRKDFPRWLLQLTTWVNSHWQELDIFNTSGGDPEVVKNRVTEIHKRFNLQNGLGLHWYEWDTLGYALGSNYTDCASEITCGFDTHYPEYFPTRKGFKESLQNLKNLGVRVTPYVNGRIFDQNTHSWKKDNAYLYMAKDTSTLLNSSHLFLYEESYGSKAVFAVVHLQITGKTPSRVWFLSW
eukprot:TRINITY_DN4512_c0_g1_i11.p1 TRINITY_DN4512_c0_g1~~TRINITY_DN4512_c0_g1_i11.p1  ORF type:complete len:475 (-),score=62.31 TRINITY_DN4512_c0_g1_i11:300-1724(-)